MCMLSPTLAHVLSSLAPLCDSGAHVVFRSLVTRLEALNTFLQTHSVQLSDEEGDIVEFLEVLSRRRHQETTFEALVQQLKQFTAFQEGASEDEPNTLLQTLLEAPRTSREVHWMHLQIDVYWPKKRPRTRYERQKLKHKNELMPVEEQELLDRAIQEVAGAVGEQIGTVPDWFVPRYEVHTRAASDNLAGEWNGLNVTLEKAENTEMTVEFAKNGVVVRISTS
ncbi:hypothetical protein GN958_ATG10762 [Phytophthora infestans]|uniref:Uncharacterized protein n=1 Tax=Phytophthora infestans TaxID=4787 RepID=A0A8S9UKL1_PHYIN|nr:hypothetical protein GN958_ATG10758 [Phytophthora infestans]KAF4140012.1 hypothetical protein GN958_ATG10762 [Phytophthora infestans]